MSSLNFSPQTNSIAHARNRQSWAVDHAETARMQTVSHSQRTWVPDFAHNQQQMRNVLLTLAWRYLHHNSKLPPFEELDYAELNKQATRKALESPLGFVDCPEKMRYSCDSHVSAIKARGGYLQLYATVAYRAWHLHESSPTIAAELGLTPVAVRMYLSRQVATARELSYPTYKKNHHTFGKVKTYSVKRASDGRRYHDSPTLDCDEIVRRYTAGQRLSEIGEDLHTSVRTVRTALIRRGITIRQRNARAISSPSKVELIAQHTGLSVDTVLDKLEGR